MGGGGSILTSRGCWWVVVNIYYLVMDYGERWWVVVGRGGYILVCGGWWWMMVDIFWLVVGDCGCWYSLV